MKCGNLDKWRNITNCENLLLFSQLVNELLFDYSIPSNRVSTLNSHYLCYDALSAIESIEYHGVPEGTLKPIMEELYVALSKDPVYRSGEPLNYFMKYQGDKYTISSKVSDLNYDDLKKTATALQTSFFADNQYYEKLKSEITVIIKDNIVERQKDLFRLVKSVLTELMDMGYSLRYIYEIMNKYFWNPKVEIVSGDQISLFFDAFTLKENEYDVVFIVNKKRMEKFISFIENLDFENEWKLRFDNQFERQFFNMKNREAIICIKNSALDPFAAAKIAKNMLSTNASVYRLFDHNYRYDINAVACGVYGSEQFYKLSHEIRAVDHTKAMSKKQIEESMQIAYQAMTSVSNNRSYDDLISIINAVKFHSHSLDSSSEENQLLDLWAIFESILDISNKHTSDRIQQVCMYLVPILKLKYIYALFLQLSSDIKNYDNNMYNIIVNNSVDEGEIVQKVCEFVLLDRNKPERDVFLKKCIDFPLLKERIEYYSSELKSTDQVYKFVEKHGERVKWQVMRIYRNRNLIIHNAKTMPYLRLLIENLHSYVDDFISYSIHTLSKGHDIESMCQELFVKECKWNTEFQKGKSPLNEVLIGKMLAL